MSSGDTMTRNEGFTVVPKWNEEASSLGSRQQGQSVRAGHQERGSLSVWTESTGTDGSRETAVQGDSGFDHKCAVHRRVVLISSCHKTYPRSSAILPTADGTQGLAPRNGGKDAKVDFSR